MKLSPDDYPLRAVGPLVYARTRSSPIITAVDDQLASDICHELNTLETVKALQAAYKRLNMPPETAPIFEHTGMNWRR